MAAAATEPRMKAYVAADDDHLFASDFRYDDLID